MKLRILSLVSTLLLANILFAGGIVTNSNQSAQFIRTLNRNASTSVDAAFYNPAGLTKLGDGFHIGISNQSIFQSRKVTSSNTAFHNADFEGTVTALVFPNLNMSYNMGNLAFSAALAPVGGGGSALWADGLPSFEASVAGMPAFLNASVAPAAAAGLPVLTVSDYALDIEFEGSSVYFGFQGGVSYKVNDMISVFAGARFVTASNKYKGHLTDIMVTTDAGSMTPGAVLTAVATAATGGAAQYTAGAAAAQTAADLFTAAGITDSAAYYQAVADGATATAALLTGTAAQYTAGAAGLDAATGDIEVDATESGTAISPIIGINLTPMEGLNIGIRYEMVTPLELEVSNDNLTFATHPVAALHPFADGVKSKSAMPALLGVGVSYAAMPALTVDVGMTYYFNTGVDWYDDDTSAVVDDKLENGYEAGISVEYALSDALTVSGGFLTAKAGALPAYQTDLSHSLDSNTLGAGIGYMLSPTMQLNIGLSNTFYAEGVNDAGDEKYNKSTFDFAIGIQMDL